MKQYNVTLKHDTGTKKIRVAAMNEDSTKYLVCMAEGCPESAIIRIREAAYYRKDVSTIKIK